MAKWISQMVVSLDGKAEGANGSIDWHQVDADYNAYAADLLESAEAILFGRITYELMAAYWTTAEAKERDPVIAEVMNRLPKYVISRTLSQANWPGTTVLQDTSVQLDAEMNSNGNVVILGSGKLVSALSAANAIDEYQLMVNPVVLASGPPFLSTLSPNLLLDLVRVQPFPSGNVLLVYRSRNASR
ncbi:dihydrofolate reductase family protein [Paenibacillus daejeonensis]|uniref:dihydrofolate reductase family protein n=1 Tax=Paenibacillus daejeonensis TaxID=135193 RepID=UPI00036D3C77|nr:dihydrofolate reductase family protein [Paenibacillus daejeonensis]